MKWLGDVYVRDHDSPLVRCATSPRNVFFIIIFIMFNDLSFGEYLVVDLFHIHTILNDKNRKTKQVRIPYEQILNYLIRWCPCL